MAIDFLMCGINGIVQLNNQAVIHIEDLRRTRDHMTRRGPDGTGEWVSPNGAVALGHRRLAIIDLSDTGLQPMIDVSGRYVIVFNGEIYNYLQLRRELQESGYPFHSTSDTEVILALFARDGTAMLSRLRGMFTIALWDKEKQYLLLARDPYGIKPLYYTVSDGLLSFASQVKALEAGGASKEVDAVGLVGFLLWGSVPEPYTIRQHIKALPAGHLMEIHEGHITLPRAFPAVINNEIPVVVNAAQAIHESVAAHCIADVPIGVFLSGGIDSTLIAASASAHLADQITTLTLRFEELKDTPFDEAPLAAKIAAALGTKHHECLITARDFHGLWEDALNAMDQPSIDGFNTYLVSRVAHQVGFKVVLSGLGGDELMGGYPSFQRIGRWQQWAQLGRRVPLLPQLWRLLSSPLASRHPKLAAFLDYAADLPGAYFLQRALFLPEYIAEIIGSPQANLGLKDYDPRKALYQLLNECQQETNSSEWYTAHILESAQYMRNQLLRDADWSSMANSLELRVPLVDSWLQSQMQKLRFEPMRSQGKAAVLRQAYPHLPAEVFTRSKTGFTIPVMNWMRGEQHVSASDWGNDSRQLAHLILQHFKLLPTSQI